MNRLSESDAEMLAQKFAEKLQQARSVSDSQHYDHHRWIAAKIGRDEAWKNLFEQLSAHILKWGALGVISGIFYAIGLALKEWAHK